MDIVEDILNHKKSQVEKKKLSLPLEKLRVTLTTQPKDVRDFKTAISRVGCINIIGELKKSAPIRGILRQDYDVGKISREYTLAGAVALSVLTEEKYFGGDLYHLIEARQSSGLPILRKDFIFEEYQIYESRYYGADAVLFIKSILDTQTLIDFVKIAISIGLVPLVEIHDEKELKEVLDISDIDVIGINNRNLKNLDVDLSVSKKLLPQIPADKLVVVESGITDHRDIKSLMKIRDNAPISFLIGTAFMQSTDISSKFKEIVCEGLSRFQP